MSVATTENITGLIASYIEQKINVKGDPIRNEALLEFKKLGLPAPKSEEYKYTPIARYLGKNFEFTVSAPYAPISDIERFFIPRLDAIAIVFINGIFSKENSTVVSPDNNLKVISLEEALLSKNEIALQHFAKYSNQRLDALTAWNTAGWIHGLFIQVPDNTVVEKPVVVYHLTNGNEGEVVTANRNLFIVGKNSKVTVVEKFDSTGKANHFLNLVTEVVVNENAEIDLYSIQNDPNNRYQYSQTEIYQKNTSRVNTYTFTLEGKFYRNNLHLTLDGEGIESHMYGLYLLNKDTLADNHTVVDHRKANSYSNELYKGIMDENSKGVFNGKIFVRPHAQKTNAFQANRNILLTDNATVNTKPQLEIWADDVKCSHGCTTGQLDEEALFYLQTRGIEKETARAMMLYAFAGELVDHIKDPILKEYLDSVISDRLHKNF